MTARPRINLPHDEIAAFCRKHRIRKLSLFGSVLRDDFTDESDVDVLVEFEEGATPGFAFARMQRELSEILGRNVHLLTPKFFGDRRRDTIVREAKVEYDAT